MADFIVSHNVLLFMQLKCFSILSFFLSQFYVKFLLHPFDLLSVSPCKGQLFSMYAVFDLLGYVKFVVGKTFHSFLWNDSFVQNLI